MAEGPPAKRVRHHYDLTKTFDVLVGNEPNQQRFTVHHDLLVQRSEFFKAARSSRWTQPEQPTTLVDHDPETFSTYLHCLYFGVDAIKDRLSLIAEQHDDAMKEPTINADASGNESSSDESSHSGKSASNDDIDNGEEDRSSESASDSDSASCEGQNEQRSTKETPQKSPEKLTVTVDGKEKEATATLFVGNLSWITEEKTLEQAFAEFGELRGVRIITSFKDGRSRGYGYIEFTNVESAAKALLARTGFELDGRGLRLDFSKPRPGTANVLNQDQQTREAREQSERKRQVSIGATDGDANEANTSQTNQDEVSTIDYNTSYSEEFDDVEDAKIRVLIKLYVLADKLIDSHAANLVIDEMVVHVDTLSNLPDPCFINIVYWCTPTGSPLRTLFRDWQIHEARYTWFHSNTEWKDSPPVDYLKDIMLESGRLLGENHDKTIDEVFRTKAISRPPSHYHQKSRSSGNGNIW